MIQDPMRRPDSGPKLAKPRGLLVLLSVLALVAAACAGATDPVPTVSTTTTEPTSATTAAGDGDGDESAGLHLVIAIPEETPSLASHWGYQAEFGHVLRNIHEPLVDLDPDTNQYVPGLATSWERIDALTWRFYLREGVEFHDGSAFDAEAAAFGLNWTFDPDNAFNIWQRVPTQFRAEVVDDFTIDIVTEATFPILLKYIYEAGIPSKAQIEDDFGAYETNPIGTGPYQFVSWERGSSYTLERFDRWWGLGDPDGRASLAVESAQFVVRPEPGSRIAGVAAGEVDFAWDLPPDDCASQLGAECVSGPNPNVVYLRIDTKHEVLGDVRIKEAIALAIDKEGIASQVLGGAQAASQLDPPTNFGHNPALRPIPFDPDRAATLVQDAIDDGVPVGDMEILLVARIGSFAGNEDVLEVVRQSLTDVGFNVRTEMQETAVFNPMFVSGVDSIDPERSVVAIHRHSGGGDAQNTVFQIYSGLGCCGTNSHDEINDLVLASQQTLDESERERLLQEISRLALERWDLLFIVPIADVLFFHGVSSDLDWAPRLDTQFLLKDVGR